ncbi:MAG: ATP-binding protein [Pseudomonadota bacterium]|nr:ATP-binding protein [Pseudomonadota bacterium]
MSSINNKFDMLRLYFDSLPTPVSVLDENGFYLYCNEAFYESFLKTSYKPFSLLGKRNSDLIDESTAKIFDSNHHLAQKLGGTQCFEESIKHPNGEHDYWLSLKKPVLIYNGKNCLIISVFINITQRKLNEKKLGLDIFDQNNQLFLNYIYANQSLNYLDQGSKLIPKSISDQFAQESLLSCLKRFDFKDEKSIMLMRELLEITLLNFPGNIYVKDDELRLKFINLNLVRDLGIEKPSDIINKTSEDFLPADVALPLKEDDLKVMASNQLFSFEEPVTLNGEERCYLSFKKSINNPYDKGKLLVGISVDYTIQKQLDTNIKQAINSQNLNQKAKESFITNISHDIRTPITGMLGLISEIKKELTQHPELENKITTLESLTKEFLNFFNSILESVENKDSVVAKKVNSICNVRNIVNSSIALFKPSIMYQEVSLNALIANDVPNHLIGNEKVIKRIVINVLGNAIKFSHKGEVKIIVTYDKTKAYLNIIVSDQGIGISEADSHKIFERFTKLDLSPNSQYKGSGLGLFIVKKYIDLLGGTISVKSKLGKGSTFSIKLPMKEADNNVLSKVSGADEFQSEVDLIVNKEEKILIVEDNKLASLALKNMIEMFGFQVLVVETGKKAFEALETNDFKCLFLDIGLPDQSGMDVLLELKKNVQYKALPVVMLSGDITKENDLFCIKNGATAVYTKPIQKDQVKNIFLKLEEKKSKNIN